MVNVQSLIVEASLRGNTETIKHAISLDPLTAAVCTLDQISAMTDEMFATQKQWLPQFA
jgi:alpha-galactosidase